MPGESGEGGENVVPWKCEDHLIDAAKWARNSLGYEHIYFNESGFLLFSELPRGMAYVVRGFCTGEGVPRIIGEVYGALQTFEALGKDKLSEFLKLLSRITAATLISAGIGPNEEIILESYIPFSSVYAPDAAKPEMTFREYVKSMMLAYGAIGLWIVINLKRALMDEPMIELDIDKVFEQAARELKGEISMPGVLQL